MKIVCEIPLNVANYEQSQFTWLDGNENLLFIIEEGKRLRLLGLQQELPREIQTASLAESRFCTNSSWNRDGSLLAIVVDKRQLYIWEFRTNTFTHFKPQIDQSSSLMARRNQRPRDIELVAWSKQSDKLAICYSTGQILLCKFVQTANVSEKFIDNSESVLKKIVSIEVSEHADLFACLSLISEVLVMTFDGQTKFYIQGENLNLFNLKFSAPINEYNQQQCHPQAVFGSQQQQPQQHRAIWLAYQSKNDGMFFKRISYDYDEFQDVKPVLNILHNGQDASSHLVDFFWLNFHQLIACFSTGAIHLIQVSSNSMLQESSTTLKLNYEEKLRIDPINQNHGSVLVMQNDISVGSMTPKDKTFKIFKLIKCPACASDPSRQAFALIAATSYKLFYYEFYEFKQRQPTIFEHIDDLDLSSSLKRVDLELKQAAWNFDCSLLALQLTSGHLLVYRTRLQDYMMALYGSKSAYLSASNEITILNYGSSNQQAPNGSPVSFTRRSSDSPSLVSGGGGGGTKGIPASDSLDSRSLDVANDNALIINVGLKPSVIAMGLHHLALALNNRIRLYSISSCKSTIASSGAASNGLKTMPYYEEEFVTIVVGLGLSSNYIAILFDDGRLKLQTIHETSIESGSAKLTQSIQEELEDNERFFPDPSKPESILAFTLTEELLLYSTDKMNINVFSLQNWSMIQVCDHSKLIDRPIRRLKANLVGNKFVCLLNQEQDNHGVKTNDLDGINIFLFDLYYNQVFPIANNRSTLEVGLFCKIFNQQLEEVSKLLPSKLISFNQLEENYSCGSVSLIRPGFANLEFVLDAIWDTDGRTLLLVEKKKIHVMAILDHTLEREQPIVEIAGSTTKSSNYNVLYVTQGIVSYQSSLGRVINSILESHDDELKLTRLEQQILVIKNKLEELNDETNSDANLGASLQETIDANLLNQCQIMFLKLAYLQTILPIYSLTKCRDICNHLMSDEQLNWQPKKHLLESNDYYNSCSKLIEQLIWRQLAAWAIFCSNLDFALSIYSEHRMLMHAYVLGEILQDLRQRGHDSRQTIKNRLLSQLLKP